jgi:UDP-N-acetylglucosamine:LPS N-acetylglucosamine transferase
MKWMMVCTSGGHFYTMRRLEPFWSQHERIWVTDPQKDTRVLFEEERVYWLRYQAPRDVFNFLRNFPKACQIVAKERPSIILSTGAGIAVTFAIAAKLLGVRFIYVESISRAMDLSLSGKLVYLLCDELYVQWPHLCARYPKATFRGYA